MSDPLSGLRGLASENKARDEELRAGFKELEGRLKDASGGCGVTGHSQNCVLEPYGDGDAYYGYLSFGEELRVGYRTSEDDMPLAFEEGTSEPTYSVKNLDNCSPVWLRALAAPKVVESLVTSINDGLEAALSATAAGLQTMSTTANLPLRDLDAGLVNVAKKLNFGDVIQQWQEAQSALGVDPPDAAARACRLLETLCKHILNTKGKPLPGDESIQSLYKIASQSLALSPGQQSSDDVRAMGSGMTTIVQNIGALRTHASTAHGTGPNSVPITFSPARLAVNTAGVLATFLMDALLQINQTLGVAPEPEKFFSPVSVKSEPAAHSKWPQHGSRGRMR